MANKTLNGVASGLLIAGGLNWGLVGLFGFNLVETLLGVGTLTTIVYGLVGAAGVMILLMMAGVIKK